jgi:hypothetical protein
VLVIMCLELPLTYHIPCLVGASLHDAAVPTRVRVITIISYLVIQFSSSSVQSTLPNHAGDTMCYIYMGAMTQS